MAEPRRGDWMQTFTGRQFWPLDPRPEEIFIEDVAHALSRQCRYAGHCVNFYSVAEHSVLLARQMESLDEMRWALLHDASEAYLVDIPRPLKRHLAGYAQAEAAVMAAVCDRFGLPRDMPEVVKEADTRIIGDERANVSKCEATWDVDPVPLGIRLRHWSPIQAKAEFLMEFDMLFGGWKP